MSKIALVTGSSSGIGLSSAIFLAKAGFEVVATMRNIEKATALRERAARENVEITIRKLDVCDPESIRTCVGEVSAKSGAIDVLINNAGAGFLGTLEQTTFEDLYRTMDTNFFGVWRVTEAVLPRMREARSGRLITVTSIGGLLGHAFNDAYCAAKFAVEGMMESLAPVVRNFGVHVSLIEPGPVATEFIPNIGPSLATRQNSSDSYAAVFDVYLRAVSEQLTKYMQSADDIARVIVEAATSPAPHLRYPTSPAVRDNIAHKYVDPSGDTVLALNAVHLQTA